MKIVIILILVFCLNLNSQNNETSALKFTNYDLLKGKDLSKIKKSPNKLVNGKREGKWTIWLSKTHFETTNKENIFYYRIAKFKNGNYHGEVKDYDFDGKLIAKGNRVNGNWDGEVEFYFDGDLDKSINYKNSKKNGKFNKYYKSGKIKLIGVFKDDKRDEKWIVKYEDGKTKSSGSYIKSEKAYSWVRYNKQGKKIEDIFYIDGVIKDIETAFKSINDMIISDIEKSKIYFSNFKKYIHENDGSEKNLLLLMIINSNILMKESKYVEAEKIISKIYELYVKENEKFSKIEAEANKLINIYNHQKEITKRLKIEKEILNILKVSTENEVFLLPYYAKIANTLNTMENYTELEQILFESNINSIIDFDKISLFFDTFNLLYDNKVPKRFYGNEIIELNTGMLDLYYLKLLLNFDSIEKSILKQNIQNLEKLNDYYKKRIESLNKIGVKLNLDYIDKERLNLIKSKL